LKAQVIGSKLYIAAMEVSSLASEQHWAGSMSIQGGFECTPSHLLPVKNTFIDWPTLEPPPLELQKHVSCPAAFELGPDTSQSDNKVEGASLWRLNGEALEVNFDGLGCVADARCRAAAVLDVSMDVVRLVGGEGVALDDRMPISELKVDDLQFLVSGDSHAQATGTELQLASLLRAPFSDGRTVDEMCFTGLSSQDELAAAISLILRQAVTDEANSERCVKLLRELKAHQPKCEGANTGCGKQASFTRVLLGVCQSEHEAALDMFAIAQDMTTPFPAGISEEGRQRCISLFSFFGDLFTQGLLALKVVREIANDLLDSFRVHPGTLSSECMSCLIQKVCPLLLATKTGKAFLSELWISVAQLQSILETNETPVCLQSQRNVQQLLDLITSSQSMPRAVL